LAKGRDGRRLGKIHSAFAAGAGEQGIHFRQAGPDLFDFVDAPEDFPNFGVGFGGGHFFHRHGYGGGRSGRGDRLGLQAFLRFLDLFEQDRTREEVRQLARVAADGLLQSVHG
jgi:hypothetical protein